MLTVSSGLQIPRGWCVLENSTTPLLLQGFWLHNNNNKISYKPALNPFHPIRTKAAFPNVNDRLFSPKRSLNLE